MRGTARGARGSRRSGRLLVCARREQKENRGSERMRMAGEYRKKARREPQSLRRRADALEPDARDLFSAPHVFLAELREKNPARNMSPGKSRGGRSSDHLDSAFDRPTPRPEHLPPNAASGRRLLRRASEAFIS